MSTPDEMTRRRVDPDDDEDPEDGDTEDNPNGEEGDV